MAARIGGRRLSIAFRPNLVVVCMFFFFMFLSGSCSRSHRSLRLLRPLRLFAGFHVDVSRIGSCGTDVEHELTVLEQEDPVDTPGTMIGT